MEKDDIKKETNLDSVGQKPICSKCKREIQSGEFYVRSILSGELTCSYCEDNRILIQGDNFFSID